MAIRYTSIIMVYLLCQISAFLIRTPLLNWVPEAQRPGFIITASFVVCLLVSGWLLLPERHLKKVPMTPKSIVNWCLIGIVMVYLTQIIAGIIDLNVLGGPPESQNTEDIMRLAKTSPYVILAVVLIGPILEEIIFRKIIFGSLKKVINVWFAALISALLFALAHNDGHLIIYGSIGLVLAFLYHKTGRIYVSMIAHGSLNGIATLLFFTPQIQHLIDHSQSGLIWGWF